MNNRKHVSGIYKIVNTLNGDVYVGKSKNLRDRKNVHFNNPLLKSFMDYVNLDVNEVFKYSVLEYLPKDDKILLEREKYWENQFENTINKLQPPTTENQRKETIDEWINSGLSQEEFCEAKKMPVGTLKLWISQLQPDLSPIEQRHKEDCIKIIDEWIESGLSLRKFCKQNPISRNTLNSWIIKYKPEAKELAKEVKFKKEKEEHDKIINEWVGSNLTKKEYCKLKNINYTTFILWIRKYRPELSSYNGNKHERECNKIIDEWLESGLIQSEFCKKKNMNRNLLMRWVKDYRPELKNYNKKLIEKAKIKKDYEHKQIIEDWLNSDLNQTQFCKKYNVPKRPFEGWLRKYRNGSYDYLN